MQFDRKYQFQRDIYTDSTGSTHLPAMRAEFVQLYQEMTREKPPLDPGFISRSRGVFVGHALGDAYGAAIEFVKGDFLPQSWDRLQVSLFEENPCLFLLALFLVIFGLACCKIPQ